MKESILVSEFLDEISDRAERKFRGRLHQAFLDWYVEAEFGSVKWEFTDDAHDGGIDAIVWRPDDIPPVAVIQSKFTQRPGHSALAPNAYREFDSVVEAFHSKGDAFNQFIASVRDDIKRIYRRAFDRLSALNNWSREKKAFRLVTTYKRRPGARLDQIPLENCEFSQEILELYRQYRKGATPKARPLNLTVKDKLCYGDPKRRVTSYIFNAHAGEFRKYLEHNDVARLVARNIRYDLGGRIKRSIKSTYENHPHDFWYLHNGLTIVCDDFTEKQQVATLVNPSVINGAQTLYALSSSSNRKSEALVATRVIVRGDERAKPIEDDEWLQNVIRGVNTQNRVRADDFRSNGPEQIELQNRFRDQKVFYERKRGEWLEFRNDPRFRSFDRLSLRVLGQILATVSEENGQGVLAVKRGIEDIFEEKLYRRLFPSRAKVSRQFKRVYLAYRIYKMLDRFGYLTTKERRKQRHAFWNSLWILHRGISSVDRFYSRVTLQSVRNAFDIFEGTGVSGRTARKQIKLASKALWSTWRTARRADPERWTPNNFFKSTFGNRKLLTLAYPKVRPGLKSLGRHIMGS